MCSQYTSTVQKPKWHIQDCNCLDQAEKLYTITSYSVFYWYMIISTARVSSLEVQTAAAVTRTVSVRGRNWRLT